MSSPNSQNAYDTIKTVVMILVGSIALISSLGLIAHFAIGAYGGRSLKGDPAMSDEAVAARLKRVGELVIVDANFKVPEPKAEALPAAAPVASAAAPIVKPVAVAVASNQPVASASAPAPADPGKGKAVYEANCSICHAAGVAGAPKFADKVAWGPRITQGADTLHNHALKGFQGTVGVMPPKGGNVSLADADVIAAVDYMASQAK